MDQDGADLADGGRLDDRNPWKPAGEAVGGRLPRPIRAVVFDLDGTLIDTEQTYRAVFHAALAELGWTLGERDYDGLVGLASTTRCALLPQLLGPRFPVGLFLDTYRRRRAIALGETVPLKPGVEAVLDLLDRAGVGYAVATSASTATASANLSAAGLSHRVPILVTRDDVARGKPHPDSFLAAAHRLGQAAKDCLAIEDSAAGIVAAHRAGMMVVTIPDAVPATPDVLRRCIASLGSLRELGELLSRELARKNDRSPLRV